MGYYVSNMFGIRLGGVFSAPTDMNALKAKIQALNLEMRTGDDRPNFGGMSGDPDHCMSKELIAHKGSYAVLAGVFNYWTYDHSSEFAKRLSDVLQTEVMHMCWDEELGTVQCQIWLAGRPLLESSENPIGAILRRVAGKLKE